MYYPAECTGDEFEASLSPVQDVGSNCMPTGSPPKTPDTQGLALEEEV